MGPPGAHASLIAQLLETSAEELPSLLGRNIDAILSQGFLVDLEASVASAAGADRESLEQLRSSVFAFGEEVAEGVQRVQPEFERWSEQEREAAVAASQASQETPPATDTEPGTLGGAEAAPAASSTGAPGADAPGAASRLPSAGANATEVERARGRFGLERLLAAAKSGGGALEERLGEMAEAGLLDGGFFSHLEWEVCQQVERKNGRLLELLELVVARACAKVEEGKPEVRLLTRLLHTAGKLQRLEIYEQQLALSAPVTKARFAEAVRDTKLALEQALMRGASAVDKELLLQLRLLSVETEPYTASGAEFGP